MTIEEFYSKNEKLFRKNRDFMFMFEMGINRIKAHWYMPICFAGQIVTNNPEGPKIKTEECYPKILATLEEYMEYALENFFPVARKYNPNIDLTYGRLTIATLYHRLPLEFLIEDLSKTKTYRPLLETAKEAVEHFLKPEEIKNQDSLGKLIGIILTDLYGNFKAQKILEPQKVNRKALEEEVRKNEAGEESIKLGLVRKGIFLREIAQEIIDLMKITGQTTKTDKGQTTKTEREENKEQRRSSYIR